MYGPRLLSSVTDLPAHSLFTTGLGSFTEPNYVVYEMPLPVAVSNVLQHFKATLGFKAQDVALTNKCSHNVICRVHMMDEAAEKTVRMSVAFYGRADLNTIFHSVQQSQRSESLQRRTGATQLWPCVVYVHLSAGINH